MVVCCYSGKVQQYLFFLREARIFFVRLLYIYKKSNQWRRHILVFIYWLSPHKFHGFSKSPKPEIPLRFIFSGIGFTTPHKIWKSFAKILFSLFDMIGNSHIENSGDLLNKINNLNMENKSQASIDKKIIIHQYSF